jgi:ABC-type transport system involved in cytochrome c biogenesis permease subunit
MKRTSACLVFLLVWAGFSAGLAADVPDSFRQVMMVENGRVMPVDTYARILLRRFSGRQSLGDRSASAWLADLLFHPENTRDEPVFLIDHPDLFNALGLVGEKRGRVSFRALEPVLSRLSELARSASRLEPARRSLVENGLLQLYEHVYQYYVLRESFLWLLPQGETGAPGSQKPSEFGLPLLPGDHADEAWQPLNAAMGAEHPFHAGVELWRRAMTAYREGRYGAFGEHIGVFNRLVAGHPVAGVLQDRVAAEVFYNRLDPFFWGRLAYGLTLVMLLLSFLVWPLFLRRFGLVLLAVGFVLHTLGLVLRFLVSFRSPVTNLYETYVFVAWAAVLLGFLLGIRRHLELCLATSGASGLVFLMIAARFANGDTLGQLVAVLNSNWWLSVHVITISAGYAGCVVAGIIGHVYIGQTLVGRPKAETMVHTMRMLYGTLIFGLFFTFLGTVMGGIWADQSWGRFWGWDPKENGALVIILWVAVILHARLARMIGPFGVAAGAVGAIIMVVLAWFGVNLLGVGMHAYGFTSGIARGLILFVTLEILFLVAAGFKARQRKLPG